MENLHPARRMWLGLEPLHATVYFTPDARGTFEAIGLKGFWMGYFASRAAPLGRASPEVVQALFYSFHPDLVRRAIPDAWELAEPAEIIDARFSLADRTLRALLGDDMIGSDEVVRAAGLARGAAESAECAGRGLFAAHLSIEWPEEPHLQLWHAATLLREHRGDGHVAILVAEDLGPCEAHVLAVAAGATSGELQRQARHWSEEDWEASRRELDRRGIVEPTGGLTPEGLRLREHVEARTDQLALDPLVVLDPGEYEDLARIAEKLRDRIVAAEGIPFPNPIGIPDPSAA